MGRWGLPHARSEAGIASGQCITSLEPSRPKVGHHVRLRDDHIAHLAEPVERNALHTLKLPEL